MQRSRTAPLPFGYKVRVSVQPHRDGARWLERVRPDVVHFHHPFPLSAATSRLACRAGIPVVATNHTIPECSLWGIRHTGPLYATTTFFFARWLVHVLNRATTVATPTATASNLLQNLGYARTVVPISNGIDTRRFSPGPARESLRRRLGLDDRSIVLYTGRLDAEKQLDIWLRSAAALSRHVNAQFVVGGKGTQQERLVRLAHALHLDNDVRFIGYVSDDDLPDLYRLAHVYYMTSPVELQSIATLEAVASGLPVVAVNAGALPELVRDGENGFLISPGDARCGAERLARLLNDVALSARFRQRSREIAMGHDLLRSVEGYERWLSTALHRDRGEQPVERVPAPGH
ncbi:MAG: hypothetical protein NVS2B16_06500 [Chloroflexota bacterium]